VVPERAERQPQAAVCGLSLRLAAERCFEIIGEAVRRLDESDRETAARITDYQRIIAFRNVLIHGYSAVKHDLVWRVVQHQLPKLAAEVKSFLVQVPPPS